MKFLVALALFACANAATYQPWQVPQRAVVQAVASASVAPQVAQPVAKSYVAQPAVAKAYSAVSQAAVQTYEPVQSVSVVKNVGNVKDAEASILRSTVDVAADGFNYSFETQNGIAVDSSGQLKKVDNADAAVVVQGSYQYLSPEGVPVVVKYIADENGFQAQSDAIPTSPPVPAAILRALEYIASQPKYVEPTRRV